MHIDKSYFSLVIVECIDFLIGNENPEDWEASMINDEESLFLAFDEERLGEHGIDEIF